MYPIDQRHKAQTPKGVRDDLGEISDAARALYKLLANGSDELLAYLGGECVAFGDPMLPERMKPRLLRLSGLARHAEAEAAKGVGAGAPRKAISRLIGRLEFALAEAGIEPDARNNGPLVAAFDVACQELRISVADAADTVQKALARMPGKQ
ncbi:hypothetical protein [Erythrobacter sp. QSSC1-22B]|uniref:hypothetical protein n=1 Tax=Erythrobacter sp. QSSC1-22B TaxID=1860125 RepID=UPI00119DB31A|nr:hypothetical protein [Erythrobacter sp. QSSC1-22B]